MRHYSNNREDVLRRQKDRYAECQIEIVFDPTGDFRSGVKFPKIQIAYGLAVGAWEDGTIFQLARERLKMENGLLVDRHCQRVILMKNIGW